MPLHPPSFVLHRATSSLWICASCLARTANVSPSPPLLRCRSARLHDVLQTASFHASSPCASAATQTHYETLELQPSATRAEIKRQFYKLSKKHHPDHNASDPNASTRFVAISEAYHVLSVPEKRAQYDAQLSHTSSRSRWGGGGHAHPQGSYSSASYAGSRPASGLNKKRSTFRGPPPSFYKSGGYGRHGAKRAEHAYQQHARAEQSAGAESYSESDGFGPGQTGLGSEVPHFNDRRHKETHHNVYEHISARRRRARDAEIPREFDRGGMLANFIMVAGVVGIAAAVTNMFSSEETKKQKAES